MCKWESEIDKSYKCRVPSLPGSDFCIFHEPGKKECALFQEELQKQLQGHGTDEEVNEHFDFTGYVFPTSTFVEDTSKSETQSGESETDRSVLLPQIYQERVSFREAVFMGTVWMPDTTFHQVADFRRATFYYAAYFHGSHFKEGAQFDGCKFRQSVDFSNCYFLQATFYPRGYQQPTFLGPVRFDSAYFEGSAYFLHARFRKRVTFIGVHFGGTADFGNSRFQREASFENAVFDRNAEFRLAQFRRGVNFSDAEITWDAYFNHARVHTTASFARTHFRRAAQFKDFQIRGIGSFIQCTFNCGADFQGAVFQQHRASSLLRNCRFLNGETAFSGSKLALEADLRNATFKGPVVFRNVQFIGGIRLEGSSFLSSTDFALSRASTVDLGFRRPTIKWIGLWTKRERCGTAIFHPLTTEGFWHFVRRTFEAEGRRESADAAYYYERIAGKSPRSVVHKIKLGQESAWHKPTAYLFWLLDLALLRWTTAYGASMLRLIATWAFVIGSFGAAYALAPKLLHRSVGTVWSLSNWVTALHYSTTTFSTLGLGDLRPEGLIAKGLTSLEAVLGGLLMALAVLVIGRKFMR